MATDQTLEERGWPDHLVRDLVARSQHGEKGARDRLVEANLRLVRSLVQRFNSTALDPEDLFQLGCIGLLKAVDRFDLSYNVRFSTYAVPLILGEIRRHLRDDGPIHVSRGLRQLAVKARRVQEEMIGSLGREPTVTELAQAICVSAEDLVEALEGVRPPSSIYQTVHEGEGDPIYLLDQLTNGSPEDEAAIIDQVALREGLAQLEPREQMVITQRFFRDQTQTEVAALMGCSQVQVSRIERRALDRIRSYMNAS